jgi:predicted TIM-barrel fold metal-dependent hydrolase
MILDLDSHLREGYFMDEVYKLEGPYEKFTPKKIGTGRDGRSRFMHSLDPRNPQAHAAHNHPFMYESKGPWKGEEIAERQVAGYDMERRLEGIKKEGIEKEIVFPTGITIPTQNIGDLGLALCQAYNNWVAKLVSGYTDVFLPVAMAPAGCPEAMAGELRRCVKELGFKASHLVPYCGSRNLDHPNFYAYYEAAQELNVPLFCHPNSNGDLTDRFDNFFKTHVLGRPMNCTPALVALVLGGIFERFPKLKVAFFECSAEWPLYWMHRMDDDYEWAKNFPHLTGQLTMAPSEYVRRNCYVTCEADEKDLRQPIAELGEDHILMATDYPHFDSEYPHTVSDIRGRTDITAQQKDKILGENAARLLNL